MLLKVVPFSWNVGRDLNAVSQPHPCHFSKSRVRFLGRNRPHLKTYTALLRVTFAVLRHSFFVRVVRKEKRWCLRFIARLLARTPDKLIDSRH